MAFFRLLHKRRLQIPRAGYGWLLLIGSCLLPGQLVAAEPLNRIIGGKESEQGAWPSAVALVRDANDSLFQRQFCGGNLIADRWVLTAAHCLYEPTGTPTSVADLRVAAGVTDLADSTGVVEHVIANIFIHPLYDPADLASYHDIALVELAQPSSQSIMRLFDGNTDALTGTLATVVGWGALAYSEFGQLPYPSLLNEVELPLVSRSICNQPQSYNGLISDSQLCAGFDEGGKDSCVGDSGGPLMLQRDGEYQQIGVVSFGRGCAEPLHYGVYTRVPAYLTWINELTGTAGATDPETPQAGTTPTPPVERAGESMTGAIVSQLLLMVFLLVRRFQARAGRIH